MNGLFARYFISRYIVLMAALLVLGKQTQPRQLRAKTQINREACPTKALVGKGPPCHKSSSRSGLKHNWEVMDGWRQ